MKYSIGAEVSKVSYNGRSAKKAKTEALITGYVTKVTNKYLWIRNATDGSIWKAQKNI